MSSENHPTPEKVAVEVDKEAMSEEIFELFEKGITGYDLYLMAMEEKKSEEQKEVQANEENGQGDEPSTILEDDKEEEEINDTLPLLQTATPEEIERRHIAAIEKLNRFELSMGTTTIDMNLIKLKLETNEEVEKLEGMISRGGGTCNYCKEIVLVEEGVVCGGCEVVVYCDAYCLSMDWSYEKSMRHGEICRLYRRDRTANRVGVLGKDVIRHYISKEFGCGLFPVTPYEAGNIVLIDRPAFESEAEERSRHIGRKMLQKLIQRKISEKKMTIQESMKLTEAEQKKILEKCNPSIAQTYRPDLFAQKIDVLRKLGLNSAEVVITSCAPMTDPDNLDVCYTLGMINHSCNPNCFIFPLGYRFYLISLRDIKAGEQITIRYDDPYALLKEDIDEEWYGNRLKNQYNIRCPESCSCKNPEFWVHCKKLSELAGQLYTVAKKAGENHDQKGSIRERELKAKGNKLIEQGEQIRKAIEEYIDTMSEEERKKIPGKFYVMLSEFEWNIKGLAYWKPVGCVCKIKDRLVKELWHMGIGAEFFFNTRKIGTKN